MKILLLFLICILLSWFGRTSAQYGSPHIHEKGGGGGDRGELLSKKASLAAQLHALEQALQEEDDAPPYNNNNPNRGANNNKALNTAVEEEDFALRFEEEKHDDSFRPYIERIQESAQDRMDMQMLDNDVEPLEGGMSEQQFLQQRFVLIQSFAPRFEPADHSSSSSSHYYYSSSTPTTTVTTSSHSTQQQQPTQHQQYPRTEQYTSSSSSDTPTSATASSHSIDPENNNSGAGSGRGASENNNNQSSAKDPLLTNSEKSDAGVSTLISRLRKQLSSSDTAVAPSSTLRSLRHEDYEDGDF